MTASAHNTVAHLRCAYRIFKTPGSLKSMNLSVYAIGDDGADRAARTFYYETPPSHAHDRSLSFMHDKGASTCFRPKRLPSDESYGFS